MGLSAEERKLVEEALPTVHFLARRARKRFPEVRQEDFVSMGHEALVDAVSTFDKARGTPFRVFAFKRIYGSMVRDSTREEHGSLHILMRKAFLADDGNVSPPPPLSLEESLEDTQEKAKERAVAWARKQAAGMIFAALKAQAAEAVDEERTIQSRFGRDHTTRVLRECVADLDDTERYFVKRFYDEEATLDEIAVELSCVKRTATRIHDRVKKKLETALRARGVDGVPPSER